MDPLVTSTLISSGANLLGGLFGGGGLSPRKAAALEAQYAREQMQNAIQWRVADAKKAGVHPLFALGANVSNSPVQVVSGDSGRGSRISQAGQDISRAVEAVATRDERNQAKAEAAALNRLTIEKAGLENDLLRSQIARLNSAQVGPAAPSLGTESHLIPGQGNSSPTSRVNTIATEINAYERGITGKEAGVVPDFTYARTARGGLAPVASEHVKQRIEDSFIPQLAHAWRNNVTPNFPWNWKSHPTKPPRSALPKGYSDWFWDMSDQSWLPANPRW